ncbi:MAG: redoxin family protein [Planctomycetes bacterium]|nr:redoxin family protein [Planctomycetota bacterium]
MAKVPLRTALGMMVCLAPWTGLARAQPTTISDPMISVTSANEDTETQSMLATLSQLGPQLANARDPATIISLNLQEAQILYQLKGRTTGTEQATWIRQLADCLNVAAVSSSRDDRRAISWLTQLKEEVAQTQPGSPLVPYITFREMQAVYSAQLNQGSDNANSNAVQENWRNQLTHFVQEFPTAEDTPNALMELATTCEFLNLEPEAKIWYQQLVENFPNNPLANKARGILRRLGLEGQVFAMALPLLNGESDRYDEPFDIDQFKGQVVMVYFWTSNDPQCARDFDQLRQVLQRHGSQGLGLLCVNVDPTKEGAREFLHGLHAPGIHVYQRGGLDGKVTTRYGVTAVPSMVLVGKEGTVVKRSVEMVNLEEEVAKQLK